MDGATLLKIALVIIVVLGIGIYLIGHYQLSFSSLRGSGRSSSTSPFAFQTPFSYFRSSSTYGLPLLPWNPKFTSPGGFGSAVGNYTGGGYTAGGNYLSGGGYYYFGGTSYSLPPGITPSQVSPYFGQIKIGGVSAYFGFGQQTQFQLSSSLPPGVNVNITNWYIKGNRGDAIVVPKAVNFYDYTGFSPETDIVVTGNAIVNFYSNTSPMAKNLRLNKCTGFLNAQYNFIPALPQSCPALFNRGQIVTLSGYCQSYLLSLGACQLPSTNFYNSLPGNNESNACRYFLNTIAPKVCWDQHRGDPDFLSNSWLIWTNQNPSFDPLHDDLKLYDQNGRLVDRYTY